MSRSKSGPRAPNGRPPFDPEDAIQAAKYKELCRRIAGARAQGKDFELRGARQIALYVKQSEAWWRWVFRQNWLPIHHEGSRLCMYVEIYETFLEVRRYCAIHRLDLDQELKRRGIYEPTWRRK